MKKVLPKVLIVLSVVMAFSTKIHAVDSNYEPTFYGVTNYEDIYSLVSISAENPEFTRIFYDYDLEANGGVFYAEGLLYSHWLEYNPYGSIDKVEQYIYDVKSGDKVGTRTLAGESAGFAMNYDETQDCVYGYFIDPIYTSEGGGFYLFGRLGMYDDLVTGLGTTVSVYEPVIAIAVNQAGECYGIDYQGRLVSVNKASGTPTVIGETGITPEDVPQSCCFDPLTGKFYWAAAVSDADNGIYEINLETGAATLAVALDELEEGEGMMGLYIPYPDPTSDSPAEVTEMELIFETTSLSGQVKFRAPSTTVGGDAITGPFKAYVFLGTTTKEIDVMPGEQYSVDMEVAKNQMYNCRVWTMIDDNRSAKHTVAKWIGADYPKAPTNLQVFEENGKVVFTWDTPPAIGVHDGYVNPDEITYIISRGTDIFITDYTGNRFEEDAPSEMASFQYYIRSSYLGLNGEYAYSDVLTIGSTYTIPLDFGFSTNFAQLTIIDANNDGNTWTAGFGSVDYTKNSNTANDWLITPKVVLETGMQYRMTLTAEAQKYFADEQLEVFMGLGATIDDMTSSKSNLGDITVSKMSGNTYVLDFTCQEGGEYNFGFHCVSTGGSTLKLYNLNIVAEGTVDINQVRIENENDNSYYDIMGRKIAVPQRGNIYINNNKVIRY